MRVKVKFIDFDKAKDCFVVGFDYENKYRKMFVSMKWINNLQSRGLFNNSLTVGSELNVILRRMNNKKGGYSDFFSLREVY